LVSDRTALLRFEQEARSAASIKSPHVVSILDYGKDASGNPYLAMEQLTGMSLEARFAKGRLSLEETLDVVVQACRGLDRAHGAGIIHRDIKPENIFLCKEADGSVTVKILDFGIAKSFGSNVSMTLTGTGQMLGTPIFMSPEQAYGHAIDSRSDLYSLGVVAFNCLTGHLPFEDAKTVGELVVAIAMRPPPSIMKWRNDLAPSVVQWFDRVLKKDPNERFQTAREMGDAFAEACAVRKMTVTISGLDVDESSRRDLANDPIVMEAIRRVKLEEEQRPRKKRRSKSKQGPSTMTLLVAAVIFLVLGVGIGLAIARYK
jgi:serine/threonine-protein kinase